MGWFWADTVTPPRPLAPQFPLNDAAPPVSYTYKKLRRSWLTAQAWMSHAQSYLRLSISSQKLVTVASRRFLMPCRLPQCASLVFNPSAVNYVQIQPFKLHAIEYLSIPFRQSKHCSTHLPHHIIHSSGRYRYEMGVSISAANVKCYATERLR